MQKEQKSGCMDAITRAISERMKMKRMIRLTEKEKMDCMSDIQVKQVIRNACVYAISELMKKEAVSLQQKLMASGL